jgi:lysophospholipase L1-like esterase
MKLLARVGWILVLCVASLAQTQTPLTFVPASDVRIEILGQYDATIPDRPRLGFPGSGFALAFRGGPLTLQLTSSSATSALTLVVDHGVPELRLLKDGVNEVLLDRATDNAPHTLEVYKRTETWQGILTFLGVQLPPGTELLPLPLLPRRKLMFIGDSVTCGAGIDNGPECKADPSHPSSNAYDAFGMLLGRRLDAQSHLVCYGGRGLERDYRGFTVADAIVNAPQFYGLGVATDEPSTRSAWDPKRWQPDAIVVSLGTNDFNLQKTKPLDEKKWVAEYVAFVHALRKDYRHSFILLTEGSIVTDPLLLRMVQETSLKLHNQKVKYVPSKHYAGLPCDAHPTRAEHQRIADDLEPAIRQALGW